MDNIKKIVEILKAHKDYISGDYISEILGVSRTAVWKYIKSLEKYGYRINTLKGKGYMLEKTPGAPLPWEIERFLNTKTIGREIIYKKTIDSTNSFAFKLALSGKPEGTCVIAEAQNSGRGRMQRTWFSPDGKNLYLSVILRPYIEPAKIYPITFISCLAVYDTIEMVSEIVPALKWPNDVLLNKKKVCGTLIEISAESDMVNFVIAGIGLNINMEEKDLIEDIRYKATSLYMETKKVYDRAYICGLMFNFFEKYYDIFKKAGGSEICRLWEERARINGKFIEVNQMGEILKGISNGIDSTGALLLNIEGKTKRVIAGDIMF
ncbi:MAG TPA: biotin--[acetyl-CoA-carboxylase] ligase [Syntrophorhabdaceae bacterium]|nr:biotin--[acetyl-CoA-carboxylase] ligase [Syntrophorhabdaceae bacterium]